MHTRDNGVSVELWYPTLDCPRPEFTPNAVHILQECRCHDPRPAPARREDAFYLLPRGGRDLSRDLHIRPREVGQCDRREEGQGGRHRLDPLRSERPFEEAIYEHEHQRRTDDEGADEPDG